MLWRRRFWCPFSTLSDFIDSRSLFVIKRNNLKKNESDFNGIVLRKVLFKWREEMTRRLALKLTTFFCFVSPDHLRLTSLLLMTKFTSLTQKDGLSHVPSLTSSLSLRSSWIYWFLIGWLVTEFANAFRIRISILGDKPVSWVSLLS